MPVGNTAKERKKNLFSDNDDFLTPFGEFKSAKWLKISKDDATKDVKFIIRCFIIYCTVLVHVYYKPIARPISAIMNLISGCPNARAGVRIVGGGKKTPLSNQISTPPSL